MKYGWQYHVEMKRRAKRRGQQSDRENVQIRLWFQNRKDNWDGYWARREAKRLRGILA